MTITVVTPWYEHPELAPAYLDAIANGHPAEVIIIDNGERSLRGYSFNIEHDARFTNGEDGLRFGFSPFRILAPVGNLGFSRACNRGLSCVQTDAVLFLNNDIRMTSPDWLRSIKDELAPGILVGPELAAPRHTMVDGCQIPYLSGWCLAGTTEDLRALGGFDETFEEPAYFGDNDLCLRARRAGMRMVAAPIGLKHLGNVTSRSMDVSGVSARNYERYATRARELLAVV